jgi:hypothetical protein
MEASAAAGLLLQVPGLLCDHTCLPHALHMAAQERRIRRGCIDSHAIDLELGYSGLESAKVGFHAAEAALLDRLHQLRLYQGLFCMLC